MAMFYIVGLGNPGTEYAQTRHNIGWLVLDVFRTVMPLPDLVSSNQYAGRITEGVVCGEAVTVLYPDTFMNHSGSAVKKLVPRGEAAQLIVVYDDVDLPLGEVKLSFGRGSGGHNGLTSIITSLGTPEFVRVRIGISPRGFWSGATKRPTGDALPKYVLGSFSKTELGKVEEVGHVVTEVLKTILKDGYVAAMNRFN